MNADVMCQESKVTSANLHGVYSRHFKPLLSLALHLVCRSFCSPGNVTTTARNFSICFLTYENSERYSKGAFTKVRKARIVLLECLVAPLDNIWYYFIFGTEPEPRIDGGSRQVLFSIRPETRDRIPSVLKLFSTRHESAF